MTPQTEAALRAYQGKYGLPVTGMLDEATQRSLTAGQTPTPGRPTEGESMPVERHQAGAHASCNSPITYLVMDILPPCLLPMAKVEISRLSPWLRPREGATRAPG